jgi:hypothetical protein
LKNLRDNYQSNIPNPPFSGYDANQQMQQHVDKSPLKIDEFRNRRKNLLQQGRSELRQLTVSPKIIQQHVFNTFSNKLKSY